VAEEAGEVVGHVQSSRAWIGVTPVVALGPIGVLPRLPRSRHRPRPGRSMPRRSAAA
jgi:predicted N-acetyltransferase YhbS